MSKGRHAPDDLEVLFDEHGAILSFSIPGGEDARLTAAESEIVRELIAGRANAEIARARGRSVRTIANQVASILRKLGVSSRVELAARMAIASKK
jgi:DNA-binding CsgD family transcriptional regulator